MSLTPAELVSRIDGFRLLEQDWDRHGALPIHPRAIEMAIGLAPVLPGTEQWAVVPTSDGGVLFASVGDMRIQIHAAPLYSLVGAP